MPVSLDSIKAKMLGKRFGKLDILSYEGKSDRGDNLWRCKCDCGAYVVGRTAAVDKETSACSTCKRSAGPKAERNRTFLLDKVFGHITVIEYAGKNSFQQGLWRCRCECGRYVTGRSGDLIAGRIRSCGCRTNELIARSLSTHGLCNHPLYSVWGAMKDRCNNDENKSYHRYGARGITVCWQWQNSFQTFYDWAMTNGYRSGLSLDRKDNDGDYSPGNCRWATASEQSQNQSRTRLTSFDITMIKNDARSSAAIAAEYGVNESTISRVKAGKTWSNITSITEE